MGNDTYTFQNLQDAVTHAVGGTPNALSPASLIVNRALDYLCTLRPWIFRHKPFSLSYLSYAITAMSRTGGLITVQSTVNHGLVPGCALQILNSTGSSNTPMNGSFTVADVTDATHFDCQQSGSPPDDTATTPGNFIPGHLPLPADFADFVTLKSATNSFRDVRPTTLEDLIDRRQFAYGSSYELYYAVSYLPQTAANLEPTPIIHLFPTPTAAQVGALQGVYLRRVPAMVNPTDLPDMPSTYHHLLYVLCRAFAVSTEEDQQGTDWALFQQMLPTYAAEDGMMQGPQFAQMRSTLHPRTYPVSQFYPNGRITA